MRNVDEGAEDVRTEALGALAEHGEEARTELRLLSAPAVSVDELAGRGRAAAALARALRQRAEHRVAYGDP